MTSNNTSGIPFDAESSAEIINNIRHQLDVLISVGAELSTEHDQNILLENIVTHAKKLTRADAATLYLMIENNTKLKFEIAHTDSMNFRMGGTSGLEIPWYPINLYLDDGQPNNKMVSAYVGLSGESLNFSDVYDVEGFDFSGARDFDEKNNYRTQSMLAIPMKNHEGTIIGVLQLLNAKEYNGGGVIPFSRSSQRLTESLASQAAVAITQNRLIENLEELFDALIKVIASAIDEKSKYTGGHIERVAELTLMLAKELSATDIEKYKDIHFNDDQLNELRVAGWLHDIGKITTPEHVVDKSTKLETIFDRVELVKQRFEVLFAQIERDYYKAVANMNPHDSDYSLDKEQLHEKMEERISALREELSFIEKINFGGEFMAPELKERVDRIAAEKLETPDGLMPLLSENEVENLKISRGTLTNEERDIINNHVVVTIKMLNELPFPEKLSRVTEYAGAHHEKLDGTGYPNKLNEEDLSLPARIMAVADIFEALTAADRPYKRGKTLSEAMKIMGFMAKDKHIDPELFEFFKERSLHLKYAKRYMKTTQIDLE